MSFEPGNMTPSSPLAIATRWVGQGDLPDCQQRHGPWAFEFEPPIPDLPADQSFPTLIAIPTTAGTGAETESTAMVTHVDKGMKLCIWHPDLKPALALLDPEMTVGLPPHLTAWTGVDAMVQAIEAICVPEFHPLCDGLALEGPSLISEWLPMAYREPDNLTARGGMPVGSCLAGIAFLKGLGVVHAISHIVGAEYDTQHGLTNAIILPVVMRFHLEDTGVKTRRMAEAMQVADETPAGPVSAVEAVLDDMTIPNSLSAIGVPPECVERIAEKSLQDSAAGTNPVAVDLDAACQLVEQAVRQARKACKSDLKLPQVRPNFAPRRSYQSETDQMMWRPACAPC